MKKIFFGILLGLGGSTLVLAGGHGPTIRPNVSVAGVAVGGMSQEDAAKALRVWWEQEKLKALRLHCDLIRTVLPDMRPSALGVGLDDVNSVAKLPVLSEGAAGTENFEPEKFEPVFKLNGEPPVQLDAIIKKAVGVPRPARVVYVKGAIERLPEISTAALDSNALVDAVSKAIRSGLPVEVPLIQGPKKISDDQLAAITEVVSEFHTHFPKRQYNRNMNIKLASKQLDGVVLLPGEQMSFNQTVGQRTEKRGFRLAGVYKNGRHDTGIGGGICQVSTTLYNASLYGNLKIVRRSNHSMPVAYVPLGRDATVDYGSLDLVIENNYRTPIAITSEFEPGTLTFRVLGKRTPGEWVKVIQVGGTSWDQSVQVIHDKKLPVGKKVVVENGTRGHSITTYRLVYLGDTMIHKESLGKSYYEGGDRIIAVGTAAPAAPAGVVPPPAVGARAISSVRSATGG